MLQRFRQLQSHQKAWWVFAVSALLWVGAASVTADSCLLHSGQTGPCRSSVLWPEWLAVLSVFYLGLGVIVPIASFVIACVLTIRAKTRRR
jgi:hypothetical protein